MLTKGSVSTGEYNQRRNNEAAEMLRLRGRQIRQDNTTARKMLRSAWHDTPTLSQKPHLRTVSGFVSSLTSP